MKNVLWINANETEPNISTQTEINIFINNVISLYKHSSHAKVITFSQIKTNSSWPAPTFDTYHESDADAVVIIKIRKHYGFMKLEGENHT